MPALPKKLLDDLQKLDHFDAKAFQAVHESGDQSVSVRFNPAKLRVMEGSWPADMSEPPFILTKPIPWSSNGYYLTGRPSFTLDPLFHAGVYYVQEASGMFLEWALKNTLDLSKPLKVLDLCAAPGGKSTLLQSLISKESTLVSNEVIKTRVPVLHQNMTRWGQMNGIISSNDPQDFKRLPGFFNVMLVDAPCSGSGLFRKDPDAINEWNEDLVNLCHQRQLRILAGAWDCLKEKGILIYCTCSYSEEENEDILDELLSKYESESLRIPADPSWNIVETRSRDAKGFGYRFYPDKLNGEGFFLSVLRKKAAVSVVRFPKGKNKIEMAGKSEELELGKFIPGGSMQFVRINDGIHVMPENLTRDYLVMKNYLYLKKAGVLAGRIGSDEWIPDHELALSSCINPQIPTLELNKPDALKYLRRESFIVETPTKGWIPVSFRHQKLGWVKMLSSRINNYYPKSWRILK